MTIIIYFSIWSNMFKRIETIPRKYNCIIFSEYFCFFPKSLYKSEMSDSFHKYRLSEGYHLALKSKFSRIKTSLRKKSWYQISIERLWHECNKSFSSSPIEKCIMENSDFWFLSNWILHAESIDVSHLKSTERIRKSQKVWWLSLEEKENWKSRGKKIESRRFYLV